MASDSIDHPVLGALLRYWQGKRGARAMPSRTDIDPVEMGANLLPHLLLCDLVERGARVRFRLVGTSIVKRLGFDPTGQYLEDLMAGGYFAYLAELNRACAAERAPIYAESAFRWGANRRLELSHLLLPLGNGGGEPAISLIGITFRSDEVFPPQIRVLNDLAVHGEQQRRAVTLAPADEWDEELGGLSVA
jgi:hypothetical protein